MRLFLVLKYYVYYYTLLLGEEYKYELEDMKY